MSDSLDRDEVLRLLERLGGDQDDEVLEAARSLHTLVADADMDWDELLAPDMEAPSASTSDVAAESSDPPAAANGSDTETLALIEELIAGPDRSESLLEELNEYKADIARGEFEASDHQYVRALYARLTK